MSGRRSTPRSQKRVLVAGRQQWRNRLHKVVLVIVCGVPRLAKHMLRPTRTHTQTAHVEKSRLTQAVGSKLLGTTKAAAAPPPALDSARPRGIPDIATTEVLSSVQMGGVGRGSRGPRPPSRLRLSRIEAAQAQGPWRGWLLEDPPDPRLGPPPRGSLRAAPRGPQHRRATAPRSLSLSRGKGV